MFSINFISFSQVIEHQTNRYLLERFFIDTLLLEHLFQERFLGMCVLFGGNVGQGSRWHHGDDRESEIGVPDEFDIGVSGLKELHGLVVDLQRVVVYAGSQTGAWPQSTQGTGWTPNINTICSSSQFGSGL